MQHTELNAKLMRASGPIFIDGASASVSYGPMAPLAPVLQLCNQGLSKQPNPPPHPRCHLIA